LNSVKVSPTHQVEGITINHAYIACLKSILALAVLQSCCAVCIQFFILNQKVSLGKEASWNNASSPLLKLFQYESHCL
jgi:hypothetical protein